MQQRGMDEFADRFVEAAADSDWSRRPRLRDAEQSDIRAAGLALWSHRTESGSGLESITEADVIGAMEAQHVRYGDEGELVSLGFQEYWDTTDEMGFPDHLLRAMKKELARKFLEDRKQEGFIVIDNREGIWLFDPTKGMA